LLNHGPSWSDHCGLFQLEHSRSVYRSPDRTLERLKQNQEVAGFTFGVIGAFYGLLLAFVIVAAWERFDRHIVLQLTRCARTTMSTPSLTKLLNHRQERLAINYAQWCCPDIHFWLKAFLPARRSSNVLTDAQMLRRHLHPDTTAAMKFCTLTV
jgi:hypothetical protein